MMTDLANKEMLVALFEEIVNQKQLDKIDEYFAEDYVEHSPTGDIQGRDAFKQFVAGFLAAFPDSHNEVSDYVSDGDLAYWTVRWTGTHTGEFNGIPATGKKVDILILNKGVTRDGKAVEHWTGNDALALMMQLGVMPQPNAS
jgi:predicted ester cyclase